jgi:dolichyl-phosphate-mannose-protein mannosyltransferase
MTDVAATYTEDRPIETAPARESLVSRLTPPFLERPLWGWLGPLAVTAFAGAMRFNRLRIPSAKAFDEIYYAHDAQSMLRYGVETGTLGPNPPESFGPPEYVVHPPLGKWMIAFGEKLFGYNSFGWRFSAAIVGTLAVLILARTVRRMTRSTLIGCIAGLLFSLDGLEYVQSRTSMLDIFLMFWVVVAFGCLIMDREQVRGRLAARAFDPAAPGGDVTSGDFGPRIGMRWWLLGCGVATGCAAASKWDGLYYLPGFAILALVWSMGAKRVIGVRRPVASTAFRDFPAAVLTMGIVPVVTYVATWTGWFMSTGAHAWDRNWANGKPVSYGLGFIPTWLRNPIRSLWHYHAEALNFDKHLDSFHAYRSNGWGWLFETRPVLYYAGYPHSNSVPNLGCAVKEPSLGCARMIYAMGTPAIWWASIPVMAYMLYLVLHRDWRASGVLVPFLFGYIPWLFLFKRTMFYFYALPLLPFICAALAITIGKLLGPRDASPNRRLAGSIVAGSYVLVVVVLFFYFLPILSARTIPFTSWEHRMWLQSWGNSSGS